MAADRSRPRGNAALVAAYVAELRSRRMSLVLRERASYVLPLFISHLKTRGVRDVRSVVEADLVAFIRYLSRRHHRNERSRPLLSDQTCRIYALAVFAFLSFLERRGLVLHNAGRGLTLPRVDRLPRRVLTVVQARRLVNAPHAWDVRGRRDRAILETLYGTGLRNRECLRLDVTDVDLGQEVLTVRDGKGKRDRMVPLTRRAATALAEYLRESRPELVREARQHGLFLSSRGGRLCSSQLGRLVASYARRASLPSVTPHAMRHTYATHLLKGRADVRHVQELLGHRSIESTVLYTRVLVEDLREVFARCHPREQRAPPPRRSRGDSRISSRR